MSFDYSTLITDRAVSDSDTIKALLEKPLADWTEAELAAFNAAALKGSYDYTDLNRVDECLEDLVARLGRMGCAVPGYERLKLQRSVQPAGRLPEGYIEVQHIRSTGTQYVDTGVTVNKADACKLVLTAQLTSSDNYAGCNGYMQFQAKIGNGQKSKITVAYENVTETISVNDVEISSTSWAAYDGQNVKLGLFKMGDTNDSWFSGSPQAGTLYACQVYSGESLIRDFVPCVSPAGAVGLYDLVDGKFYGNSGTGVFFAGPRKVTLPEDFTQVEYIQSSGAEYVDTGFVPNQNTRMEIDEQLLSTSTHLSIFGVRQSNSNLFWAHANSSSQILYGYGSSKLTASCTMTERLAIDADKTVLKVNGASLITAAAAAFTAAGNVYLFAVNNGGALQYAAPMKLYGCRIYDNGALARDYIPCTNASGAAGLYDLVTQEFCGNAGSGSFTAGEAVTWPEEPDAPSSDLDPYTWYEIDVPTAPQLAQYRANVAAIRSVLPLPEGTPEPPATLERLTTAAANSIELVLLAVDRILNNIPAAVRHTGVTVCGSKGVIA